MCAYVAYEVHMILPLNITVLFGYSFIKLCLESVIKPLVITLMLYGSIISKLFPRIFFWKQQCNRLLVMRNLRQSVQNNSFQLSTESAG